MILFINMGHQKYITLTRVHNTPVKNTFKLSRGMKFRFQWMEKEEL
jgi:hypothetical protein